MASRILRAGIVTGIVDGLFSSVLVKFFYGSSVTRLWQGVASTLVGAKAIDGGALFTALGVVMHFGVALAWSAVFVLVMMRFGWVQRLLHQPGGFLTIASIYGPLIWLVMSLAIVPALTHRPPSITFRWWVQFFGHTPFVGLPIVAVSARKSPR